MRWRRDEVVAAREGWKVAVKVSRVSRAESWVGCVRRVGSIGGGAEEDEEEEDRLGGGGGGWRRDSQVSRSVRRLLFLRLC